MNSVRVCSAVVVGIFFTWFLKLNYKLKLGEKKYFCYFLLLWIYKYVLSVIIIYLFILVVVSLIRNLVNLLTEEMTLFHVLLYYCKILIFSIFFHWITN